MYTCGERRKDVPSPCMRRLQRCSTCPMHARVRGGTAENADFRCTDRSGRVAARVGMGYSGAREVRSCARRALSGGPALPSTHVMACRLVQELLYIRKQHRTLSRHTHTCSRENYTTARAYIYRYPRARRAAPRASNRGPARRQRGNDGAVDAIARLCGPTGGHQKSSWQSCVGLQNNSLYGLQKHGAQHGMNGAGGHDVGQRICKLCQH